MIVAHGRIDSFLFTKFMMVIHQDRIEIIINVVFLLL